MQFPYYLIGGAAEKGRAERTLLENKRLPWVPCLGEPYAT